MSPMPTRHSSRLLPAVFAALAAACASAQGPVDPSLLEGLGYRCVGPTRGGRVTTVTGVAQRPGHFYLGSVGGGVWKTTDFGIRWQNVSDGFFATGSIGAIRVAPSDPDIVYACTGSDGLRSNVIVGRGVYRSKDAGTTWELAGLRDVGQIGAVEIDPRDPDHAWVAAIGNPFAPNDERGVFRTRDGGRSWDKVLFVSDRCGAVDLELNPADPDEVYACMWRAERKPWTIISGGEEGGVYKSVDGGAHWRKLGGGLPAGLVGKSDLAVSAADPDRLYVLIEAPEPQGGLYRSDDRGDTFRLVSDRRGLCDRPFYYTNVDADPGDPDVLYVSATRFWRSRDGGASWRTVSTPHGDNHDVWIDPTHPDVLIQANDGGASVTLDGGESWSTQHNQPTAELYQVAVDDRFPYWLYAGQQDNSTIRVPSLSPYPAPGGPTAYWQSVGGCETGPAVPKPGDPDIVYSGCKGRFGRFDFKTGQEKLYWVGAANMYGHDPADLKYRFQRVSPIVVSPHDPGVVYHASQFLHKTTDEGETWQTISPDLTANRPDRQGISGEPITRDITGEEFYSTIYAVAESRLEKGLIWVGANDGPIHVTRDGGGTWTDVTPEGLLPGGRVQTVEPSPHRAGKCYAAVLRYQLGDPSPQIWRTDDYGRSWTRMTSGENGIPGDTPTRVVREDPDREGLLYAGTEYGMFVSFDDGARWQPLQLDLPVVPVTDLVVHEQDLVVSTMGRSFWILDDVTRLHQLDERVASADPEVHLFTPRAAYRLRTSGRGRGRSGSVPDYAAPAANIDYYMAGGRDDLTLEILDGEGAVVRTFTAGRERRGGGARLATGPGAHRFHWDLRRDVPTAAEAAGDDRDDEPGDEGAGETGGEPGSEPAGEMAGTRRGRGRRGPLVAPGHYTVRLMAGPIERTVPLEVRIDPRVAADGVTREDLAAQAAVCLRVIEALGRARGLSAQVRRERESLASAVAGGRDRGARASERDAVLAGVAVRLDTASGPYPQPMLIDQLSYLLGMLDAADQRPGRDAYERIAELEGELARCAALAGAGGR